MVNYTDKPFKPIRESFCAPASFLDSSLAGEAIPDYNVTFWNLHILWERVEPFPKI